MQKKEQEFLGAFRKWLKANHWGVSFPFEAKFSYTKKWNLNNSFPQDKITGDINHELLNLHNAKHENFYWKISDYDRMHKPFDGFFYANCPEAWVVVKFMGERGNKRFYIIDVDVIINLLDMGTKSLTETEVEHIASRIEELK